MKEILLSMITAAVYAVFLRNLLFSGGLGTTEVIRAAQRNSEIALTALLVSLFSAAAGVVSRLVAVALFTERVIGRIPHWRFSVHNLPYAWLTLLFALILLALYLLVCGVIALLPIKSKRLLHKRMGMSVLNTLVMAVPLLSFRMGYMARGMPHAIGIPHVVGMGLGAGLAFLIVTMLVNSGMHILQQNKAIPSMFTGVPATLIYTGLLALAFTGFTGEILFQ